MVVFNFIVTGLLLIILQTTICMPTPIWLPAPDFYYVLVAYLAFRLDLLRSLIILFPLVCILDVLSGTILGMYALLCFSGYFLTSAGFRKTAGQRAVVSGSAGWIELSCCIMGCLPAPGTSRAWAADFLVLVEDDRADDTGYGCILSSVSFFRLAPETFPSQFSPLEQIAPAHRQPAQAAGLNILPPRC